MALTRQQLAEITAWINQYAARTEQLTAETVAVVLAAYAGVNFYSTAPASAAAEEAAEASRVAQLVAAGLAMQYLGMVTSQMVGSPVGIPNLSLPKVRNGVDPHAVYERPMKMFRRLVADGVSQPEAFQRALGLAAVLVEADIRLTERAATQRALTYLADRVGVTGYRRVIHPELSRTGTCGLCIAASDVRYSVRVLMPLHDRCKCEAVPIIGDLDPGNSLNNLALGDLYDAAGGTSGRKLKETRYVVAEHGEKGPVLVLAGQKFTGPDDLAA